MKDKKRNLKTSSKNLMWKNILIIGIPLIIIVASIKVSALSNFDKTIDSYKTENSQLSNAYILADNFNKTTLTDKKSEVPNSVVLITKSDTNSEKASKKVASVKTTSSKKIVQKKLSSRGGYNSFNRYNEKVHISYNLQKYLYNLCIDRNLNYAETLAIIKAESGFNAKAISSTKDYGLMQINIGNHKDLSAKLKTANKPLDPYVNLNWGTYKLSSLKNAYAKNGIKGKELRNSVLSSYNKGVMGFRRSGMAKSYINRFENALTSVKKWY